MAVVLKGGTLIDGTGAKPLAKAVVVIEGERITKVGKESDFGGNLAALGEVMDVTGKTVMPGLINCPRAPGQPLGHGALPGARAPGHALPDPPSGAQLPVLPGGGDHHRSRPRRQGDDRAGDPPGRPARHDRGAAHLQLRAAHLHDRRPRRRDLLPGRWRGRGPEGGAHYDPRRGRHRQADGQRRIRHPGPGPALDGAVFGGRDEGRLRRGQEERAAHHRACPSASGHPVVH